MPDRDDLRQVWQRQSTESFRMSPQESRLKAQERESRFRSEALRVIAICVALAAMFAWAAIRAHGAVTQIGWGIASLSTLLVARQARRWILPGRLAADATPEATLRFLRGVLERRLEFETHGWRRSGLAFV